MTIWIYIFRQLTGYLWLVVLTKLLRASVFSAFSCKKNDCNVLSQMFPHSCLNPTLLLQSQARSSAQDLTFRNQIRNQASLDEMLQSCFQHQQKSFTQMVPVGSWSLWRVFIITEKINIPIFHLALVSGQGDVPVGMLALWCVHYWKLHLWSSGRWAGAQSGQMVSLVLLLVVSSVQNLLCKMVWKKLNTLVPLR